jgi:hypothetical protein
MIQTEVADGHFKSRVTDESLPEETTTPNSKLEPRVISKPEQKPKPEPKPKPHRIRNQDDDSPLFD